MEDLEATDSTNRSFTDFLQGCWVILYFRCPPPQEHLLINTKAEQTTTAREHLQRPLDRRQPSFNLHRHRSAYQTSHVTTSYLHHNNTDSLLVTAVIKTRCVLFKRRRRNVCVSNSTSLLSVIRVVESEWPRHQSGLQY